MQNFDHNIGLEKNANFFAENCRKSQKIVIIKSTPGPRNLPKVVFFGLKICRPSGNPGGKAKLIRALR
jgi:hypothetical protein